MTATNSTNQAPTRNWRNANTTPKNPPFAISVESLLALGYTNIPVAAGQKTVMLGISDNDLMILQARLSQLQQAKAKDNEEVVAPWPNANVCLPTYKR